MALENVNGLLVGAVVVVVAEGAVVVVADGDLKEICANGETFGAAAAGGCCCCVEPKSGCCCCCCVVPNMELVVLGCCTLVLVLAESENGLVVLFCAPNKEGSCCCCCCCCWGCWALPDIIEPKNGVAVVVVVVVDVVLLVVFGVAPNVNGFVAAGLSFSLDGGLLPAPPNVPLNREKGFSVSPPPIFGSVAGAAAVVVGAVVVDVDGVAVADVLGKANGDDEKAPNFTVCVAAAGAGVGVGANAGAAAGCAPNLKTEDVAGANGFGGSLVVVVGGDGVVVVVVVFLLSVTSWPVAAGKGLKLNIGAAAAAG